MPSWNEQTGAPPVHQTTAPSLHHAHRSYAPDARRGNALWPRPQPIAGPLKLLSHSPYLHGSSPCVFWPLLLSAIISAAILRPCPRQAACIRVRLSTRCGIVPYSVALRCVGACRIPTLSAHDAPPMQLIGRHCA